MKIYEISQELVNMEEGYISEAQVTFHETGMYFLCFDANYNKL